MTVQEKYVPGTQCKLYVLKKVIGRTMDGFGGVTALEFWTDDDALIPLIRKYADIGVYEESLQTEKAFVGADGHFYDGCFRRLVNVKQLWTKEEVAKVQAIEAKLNKALTPEDRSLLQSFGILRPISSLTSTVNGK